MEFYTVLHTKNPSKNTLKLRRRLSKNHFSDNDHNKPKSLINNPAYVDLIQGGEIDIAISPQQATVGSLLSHVRSGDMVNVLFTSDWISHIF